MGPSLVATGPSLVAMGPSLVAMGPSLVAMGPSLVAMCPFLAPVLYPQHHTLIVASLRIILTQIALQMSNFFILSVPLCKL